MFSRPPRRTQAITGAAIVVLLGMAIGASAVAVNAFGAGDKFDRLLAKIDRFVAGPPPDRGAETVLVTEPPEDEEPIAEPTPTPVPTPARSLAPGATPTPTPEPTPTPTPKPVRKPVDFDIEPHPRSVFASEVKDTWCSPAGVQMTLAVLGLADTSDRFQAKLQSRVREWESRPDSHNGDWGPSAMALALDAYGAPGYEVRAYKSRTLALRDAARAIRTTRAPVILLAWRGAHTWVMTGYRADADPVDLQEREGVGGLHPRPVVPAHLEHLGPLRRRPGRSRTPARWSATTSPGSGPRGSTRTGTGSSSRSCRPSGRPRRSAPPARLRPRRPPRSPVRSRAPGRAGTRPAGRP